MKTLRTTIAAMMIMLASLAASAQPMSVYAMRNNARFLTDRMAYTLGLSASLLEDLYYINYDYICGVNDYLDLVAYGYRYDDYMEIVYARDYALRRLLNERQWARLMTYDYFYRPISFSDRRWSFSIYLHDRRMDHFFYRAPRRFDDYRGGRFFGGMRRVDVPGMPPAGAPISGGLRPGDPRPGNAPDVRPGNANPGYRIGDNRMGDMRGEVVRQGTATTNPGYHFESVTPNSRGTVTTPSTRTVTPLVPVNVNRSTSVSNQNMRTSAVGNNNNNRSTTVNTNTRSTARPTTSSPAIRTVTTIPGASTRSNVSAPANSNSSSANRTGGNAVRVSAGRR